MAINHNKLNFFFILLTWGLRAKQDLGFLKDEEKGYKKAFQGRSDTQAFG